MLKVPLQNLPTHTWLASLNKFIYNDWAQVDYTAEKSAKSNDAAPVFKHWYSRITEVLPKAAHLIQPLQYFLMRCAYRRLYREFLFFLNSKYGFNWPSI